MGIKQEPSPYQIEQELRRAEQQARRVAGQARTQLGAAERRVQRASAEYAEAKADADRLRDPHRQADQDLKTAQERLKAHQRRP